MEKQRTKYALAIFDMDGTILNTLEDLAGCLNHSLTTFGYPARTIEEVRQFVGNGIQKLVERGVPQGTALEQTKRVYEEFHRYYKEHCMDTSRPYDGIGELLDQLHEAGIKLAVVSNKADYAVQELCERFFPEQFDMAVGEREGIRRKPAPDSVFTVMKQLKMPAERTLYIGDSEVDIMTAQQAGIDDCIVTWGFRDSIFLKQKGASLLVSSTDEIRELFLSCSDM